MAVFGKKKKTREFPEVIPVSEAIRKGDIYTKMTCLFMGAGNLARKQILQGLLFLAGEVSYICFMFFYGINALYDFITLGTATQTKVFNEATQVYEYTAGDNSQLCLLYGVVTIFVTIGFILLWRAAVRSSYIAQKAAEAGREPESFFAVLKSLKNKRMYQVFLFFPFMGIVLFTVMPLVFMILMAFTNYDRDHLPPGSLFDWVGFENFQTFFNSYQSKNLIWNTITLSLYSLVAGFPFPIFLALMMNQIRAKRFKQTLQVVTYLPHFISTVVMVGIMLILLSPSNGIYGNLAHALGIQNPPNIMGQAGAFQHIYVWSDVWQHAGWDSIIYIAALAAIDPSLYEAATVDGASKLQRLIYIDLPFLIPTAVILLIMRAGNVMNLGFEKVYLMQNPLNTSVSEVISTYVYKIGMISNQYSLSAAVNLFNTVINFVLLVLVNGVSKKLGDTSLW